MTSMVLNFITKSHLLNLSLGKCNMCFIIKLSRIFATYRNIQYRSLVFSVALHNMQQKEVGTEVGLQNDYHQWITNTSWTIFTGFFFIKYPEIINVLVFCFIIGSIQVFFKFRVHLHIFLKV